jgi:hypothetical protein
MGFFMEKMNDFQLNHAFLVATSRAARYSFARNRVTIDVHHSGYTEPGAVRHSGNAISLPSFPSVAQQSYLVIDPANQRTAESAQRKSVPEADEASDKGDTVTDEILTQQLKVWPHMGTALQDKPVGGKENDKTEDHTESKTHHLRIQEQYTLEKINLTGTTFSFFVCHILSPAGSFFVVYM